MNPRCFLTWTAAAALTVGSGVQIAQAQLGTGVTYQGQLKDGGVPVTEACEFAFSLWDDPSAGSQIGTTQYVALAVVEGLFTAHLNAGGEFGADAFNGQPRWLEITVTVGEGAPTTLTPRQELTPTPHAHYSAGAPWAGLIDMPPGFVDGVDDDTTYAAGDGLELDAAGGVFSLEPSYMLPQACGDGQVVQWNATLGIWECADDQIGGDFWSLTGNDNTTPGTHFLGTTNLTALDLRVNSVRALRIEPSNTVPNLIGGDAGNTATLNVAGASIGGGGLDGYNNRVTDDYGTVGGGANNQAGDNAGAIDDTTFATVGGGISNTAGGQYATVSGGRSGLADGMYATVGGGWANFAKADFATIAGGGPSDIYDQFATNNRVYDHYGTIGGGGENRAGSDDADSATATYATVGGGFGNEAAGHAATVPGGSLNSAAGDHSFAAGRRAKANHAGSFAWADSTDADFASTDDDQFIIRADGGVGIGTNEPSATLHLKQEDSVFARFDHGGDRNWTVGSSSLDNQALTIVEADGTGNVTRARFKAGGDIALAPVDGNVGIGTSWPSSPLTVVGIIESTTGGFMFPDGTTQATAATGGGASLWNQSGSDIYYDAGNVGIGTSAPAWPLDVEAAQAVGRFVSTGNTYGSVLELRNNDPNATHLGAINFRNDAGAYVGQLGYSAANEMTFRTNSAEAMRIDDAGYVGIGTDDPLSPVHVEGDFSAGSIGLVTAVNTADDPAPAIYAQHTDAGELGCAIRAEASFTGIAVTASGIGDGDRYGATLHAEGGGGDHHGTFTTASGTGTNYGIKAVAGGGAANYGGHFVANNSGATGVYGEAADTGPGGSHGGHFVARSGGGWGVFAEASGDYGIGVLTDGWYGIHASGTGALGSIAVFGENPTGGHAGWFNGDVQVDGTTTTEILTITGGSDLSEKFDISSAGQAVAPGAVVCIDPDNPGKLVVSSTAYDRTVAGIVSGAGGIRPGMLMGQEGSNADGALPVALSGRVYCLVDASNGPIVPGDLLTTSDTLGHAMKVTNHSRAQGAIIGKAMTSLDSGIGMVLVLVSLQ